MSDQVFIKGAINDVNGTATDVQIWKDWDERYSTAEIGWTPAKGERYFKSIYLMGWHADEREQAGIEESEGLTVGANWTFADSAWMVFGKFGWSDGSAPLYNESYTLGLLHHFPERSDLLGLAANMGTPPGSSEEQWSSELFYRIQIAENLALTPSVQYIGDPALSEDSSLWYGSIRFRITL